MLIQGGVGCSMDRSVPDKNILGILMFCCRFMKITRFWLCKLE